MRTIPLLILCVSLAGCGDDVIGTCKCDPSSEYCRVQYSDIGGPDTQGCEPLPEACAPDSTCDCLDGLDFCLEFGTCSLDDRGMITVGCPGG